MEKIIESHKNAAKHLEGAAKHHHEAAKHHETASHDKAHQSTIIACGHTAVAKDSQKEILKHHVAKK